jgi:hypothetical protein
MKMIHSSTFQGLPVVDQYLNLAHGYLEGSRELCDAMIKGNYMPEYPHTRVILHLCRQAIELFIKGAISYNQTNQQIKGHELDKLIKKYKQEFPEPQFQFEIPFGFENTEISESLAKTPEVITKIIKFFYTTLDQSHRYPTDVKGNLFLMPEGFIPVMFVPTLEKLSKDFSRIELELKKKDLA